ncbi:MAG TPA: TIGR03435 family protein [Verrucomicrobiae bacterium]|nr:TIGR03435 family protein [Verrucomicrobiae bacterium]
MPWWLAKDGPKFKESAADAVFYANHGVNGRNQNLVATKFTMENLAADISAGRPVVNRTGLTGAYDIKLGATPEFRLLRDPQPDDIRIFEAVQDQRGLRLVPEEAMIEVLAVEHVEKPTAN